MTNKQIQYIFDEIIHDSIGVITPMPECKYFTMLKLDNKLCDPENRYKFEFIGDDCLVYCYKCKAFDGDVSDLTEGVHYDVIDNITYLYLLDKNNNPIYDIYSGKEIIQFALR